MESLETTATAAPGAEISFIMLSMSAFSCRMGWMIGNCLASFSSCVVWAAVTSIIIAQKADRMGILNNE